MTTWQTENEFKIHVLVIALFETASKLAFTVLP